MNSKPNVYSSVYMRQGSQMKLAIPFSFPRLSRWHAKANENSRDRALSSGWNEVGHICQPYFCSLGLLGDWGEPKPDSFPMERPGYGSSHFVMPDGSGHSMRALVWDHGDLHVGASLEARIPAGTLSSVSFGTWEPDGRHCEMQHGACPTQATGVIFIRH